MRGARDVLLIAFGAWLVYESIRSAVLSTILPRGVRQRLTRWVFLSLRVLFRLAAGREPTYERRDRIMAVYGPIALLALLSAWYILVIAGYTAVYFGIGIRGVGQAFRLSGSAVVTLGTTSSPKLLPSILTYTEAGVGLLLLTLLITYLPTIYAAYSQREAAVTALEVRAGNPPHATTLLLRFQRIGMTSRLTDFWQQWETWFTALEETHTTFSVLPFFRSPQPDKSWVTAAGTVLDAASLWAAAIDHPNDPDAQLCIRAGFVALRRLADFFQLPHDSNPNPDDLITITREEFDAACRTMAEGGLPVKADLDAAWRGYAGWRVNYDAVLLNLARMVEAPIAPWTSDRSPVAAWTLRGSIMKRTNRPGRWWRRRSRRP